MLRKRLANWALSHLFRLPRPEEVLAVRKDRSGKVTGIILGGKELTREQVKEYREQALAIHHLPLTSLMRESLRTVACLKMFNESKTPDDLLASKMVLWTLDVEEKLLRELKDSELALIPG